MFRDGGDVRAFQELVGLLLSQTVLRRGQMGPSLISLGGSRLRTAGLGGPGTFLMPLSLTNDLFLGLQISLHLLPAKEGGERWKVIQSRFQYQLDPISPSKAWIFRYDYIRQPTSIEPGIDAFVSHLNVNGRHINFDDEVPLTSVHFPTRRMSIESVLRLLITQYHVPTNSGAEIWRPMLAEAEHMFQEIAHENPPPA